MTSSRKDAEGTKRADDSPRPSGGPVESGVLYRGRWLTTRREAYDVEFAVRFYELPRWLRSHLPTFAVALAWMRTRIAMRGGPGVK